MWKRSLLIAALAALPVSSAMAEDSTGCGAGTILFDGQQGIAPQVLAVTTNGILGNQTFGITTGTLGCDQDGVVRSPKKLSKFIGNNMNKLASDMAAGGGETLASLAELMGIQGKDRRAFYDATKRNFPNIYEGEGVTAGEVLENLNTVMAASPRLEGYIIT